MSWLKIGRLSHLFLILSLLIMSGCQSTSGIIKPGSQCEDCGDPGADHVLFDVDKSNLSPEASAKLDYQAEWLKKNPNVKIIIEGHTDERGTREYNLALGERRAVAAQNYLVASGISADRIKTISYGKERPAVLSSNETAWEQNRRAVTVLAQ